MDVASLLNIIRKMWCLYIFLKKNRKKRKKEKKSDVSFLFWGVGWLFPVYGFWGLTRAVNSWWEDVNTIIQSPYFSAALQQELKTGKWKILANEALVWPVSLDIESIHSYIFFGVISYFSDTEVNTYLKQMLPPRLMKV